MSAGLRFFSFEQLFATQLFSFVLSAIETPFGFGGFAAGKLPLRWEAAGLQIPTHGFVACAA